MLLAEAGDRPSAALTEALSLQLDERYPGKAGYRIKRLPEKKMIAILGVDADGVTRGARNWQAFLEPLGHWLLPE